MQKQKKENQAGEFAPAESYQTPQQKVTKAVTDPPHPDKEFRKSKLALLCAKIIVDCAYSTS